jgi:hypothetical protein
MIGGASLRDLGIKSEERSLRERGTSKYIENPILKQQLKSKRGFNKVFGEEY